MVRIQLPGIQLPCLHRQGAIFPERRRQADAGQQRPAAAGAALLQPIAKVRWERVMPCRRSIAAMALGAALSMTIAGLPASGSEMKYPDWEGQWRNPTANRGGNPWDPTKPMGRGQEAPLT